MEQSNASFMLLLKRRYRITLLAILLAVGLLFAGVSPLSTAHAAPTATVHGCPSGFACIYPENKGWNGNHPSLEYYTYGVHELYGQYGPHNVLNNQTGGAFFYLCTDTSGNHCPLGFGPGSYGLNINLTPYNSVKLTPHA